MVYPGIGGGGCPVGAIGQVRVRVGKGAVVVELPHVVGTSV